MAEQRAVPRHGWQGSDGDLHLPFGIRYVSPSQVVVDCLTGNGRMPSEGEALLNWMLANEQEWRPNSLANAVEAGPG